MPKLDVEISPLAFSKIIDWTASNTEREVGGYLIGHLKGEKVVIVDSTFAVKNSTPTHVQLDEMEQFRILQDLERKGKMESILGFWHSHPGIGCFMSGTDVATQKIYQALLPESVAMVNDGNIYAKTQQQKDFKAKFYRVDGNSYKEVNFGVLTDPNELLNLLTDFVQDEENIESIVTNTVQKLSINVKEFIELLAKEKLVTNEEYKTTNEKILNILVKNNKAIDNLKQELATKEELREITKATCETQINEKRRFIIQLSLTSTTIFLLIIIIILLIVFNVA
ncbi:MAG: hypothetical protein FK734_12960 [Asgard group archaeon]|nr:hypothetical protein [Asgard group archaeon]